MINPPIDPPTGSPSRRSVLLGAGLLGAGGALAACSSSGDATGTSVTVPTANGGGGSGDGAGEVLGKTSDVPVGSGTIFADAAVVVTQPTAGDFKGFSTRCPHQGCAVSMVRGKTISCPCHGSTFSVVDGSRTGGPAPTGLTPEQVAVQGNTIVLA